MIIFPWNATVAGFQFDLEYSLDAFEDLDESTCEFFDEFWEGHDAFD